jgi:hypothetical protein
VSLGPQVMNMDTAVDDLVAEFISLAIGQAALDAAASHPGAEAFGLVLAAVLLNGGGAAEILAPRGAAKFAGPNDQRCLQAGRGPSNP